MDGKSLLCPAECFSSEATSRSPMQSDHIGQADPDQAIRSPVTCHQPPGEARWGYNALAHGLKRCQWAYLDWRFQLVMRKLSVPRYLCMYVCVCVQDAGHVATQCAATTLEGELRSRDAVQKTTAGQLLRVCCIASPTASGPPLPQSKPQI